MPNDGASFDVVYFDFKSASGFSTHSQLVKAYEAFGVDDRIIAWIRAFYQDRCFKVLVNGKLSEAALASARRPQGTLVGCLFYAV